MRGGQAAGDSYLRWTHDSRQRILDSYFSKDHQEKVGAQSPIPPDGARKAVRHRAHTADRARPLPTPSHRAAPPHRAPPTCRAPQMRTLRSQKDKADARAALEEAIEAKEEAAVEVRA